MADLHEQMVAAYKLKMDACVEAMTAYVDKHIVKLSKADAKLLTPEQLDSLRQIIIDYHRGFIAEWISPSVIPTEVLDELQRKGIVTTPVVSLKAIDESFYYGRSIVELNKVDPRTVETLSYEDYRKLPKKKLTAAEQNAVEWSRHAAGVECQGLGNKISDDFATTVIEADADLRRRMRQTISETVSENIERQESWRKITTDLGDKTDDWARDLRRIAATEKTKAVQEGIATELMDRDPVGDGSETFVAKIPTPDACPSCIKLHLTAGTGSPPKIFRLSELVANGTNRGKKQVEWKAVVGATHPWCFPPGTMVGEHVIEAIQPGHVIESGHGNSRAVQRTSKRHFVGDLIVLTAGDQVLKTTPEHPLLTTRGWVAAEDIETSDQLMHVVRGAVYDADALDIPAQHAEEAFLLRVLRFLSLRGVPLVGIDFDSNPVFREPDVDVVDACCELWCALVTRLSQEVVDGTFVGSERRALLASLRTLHLLDHWPGAPPDRIVGWLRDALSCFRAAAAGDDPSLLADRPDPHTSVDQAGCDGAPGGAEALRKLFHALEVLFVQADDVVDGQIQGLRHEPYYHGVSVTAVEREPYDGFVYNLSVEGDETFTANGFVVHNCGCELIEVPEGWGFDEDGDLIPLALKRSDFFERDLQKSLMTYKDVPDEGVAIRVGDPQWQAVIDKVVADTPSRVFTKDTGVTLILMDTARPGTALDHSDLAYWTGNEIRLAPHIPLSQLEEVLRHEIAHSLAVHLQRKFGGVKETRAWMRKLYALSQDEGFVSRYARENEIENHAETTREYLYNRRRLMLGFPRTFAMLHKHYKELRL